MVDIFSDWPRHMEWFYERNAEIWKKTHQSEILDALDDQRLLQEFPLPPEFFIGGTGDISPEMVVWLETKFTQWLRRVKERSENDT